MRQWRQSGESCGQKGLILVGSSKTLNLPKNVSESVKRLNPDLFGLGPGETPKREPRAQPALVRHLPRKQAGAARVEVVVSLVVCQRTLFDSDNAVSGGCKALRDAIAESLGCDDGDKRVRWEYGQLQTSGEPGVIVKIQRQHA